MDTQEQHHMLAELMSCVAAVQLAHTVLFVDPPAGTPTSITICCQGLQRHALTRALGNIPGVVEHHSIHFNIIDQMPKLRHP
jgi:hypothetical protein